LDVLTYNIEGLPSPARKGRTPFLQKIGEHLAELRASGNAPDVVMFQEMFSKAAAKGVVGADYPSLAVGPSRTQRREMTPLGSAEGKRKPRKGEIGMHFSSGGLAITSEYPIVLQTAEPFSKHACAGFDCLSNKGVLFARIAVPGLPDPVDLFDTHMNSQKSSKVNVERRDSAHAVQTRELKAFVVEIGNFTNPAIAGGDFNMRGNDERYQTFKPEKHYTLVHQYCLEHKGTCKVRVSWDGDEPWMDTQDLLYFHDGNRVTVRPVRVETMFDGRPNSPKLSDHDGFRVLYELSWPAKDTMPTSECWASP